MPINHQCHETSVELHETMNMLLIDNFFLFERGFGSDRPSDY